MKRTHIRFFRVLPWLASTAVLIAHDSHAQTWTNLATNSGFLGGGVAPWVAKSNAPSASFGSVTVSTDGYTTLQLVAYDSSTEVTDLEVGQAALGITAGRTYRVTFWGMA